MFAAITCNMCEPKRPSAHYFHSCYCCCSSCCCITQLNEAIKWLFNRQLVELCGQMICEWENGYKKQISISAL